MNTWRKSPLFSEQEPAVSQPHSQNCLRYRRGCSLQPCQQITRLSIRLNISVREALAWLGQKNSHQQECLSNRTPQNKLMFEQDFIWIHVCHHKPESRRETTTFARGLSPHERCILDYSHIDDWNIQFFGPLRIGLGTVTNEDLRVRQQNHYRTLNKEFLAGESDPVLGGVWKSFIHRNIWPCRTVTPKHPDGKRLTAEKPRSCKSETNLFTKGSDFFHVMQQVPFTTLRRIAVGSLLGFKTTIEMLPNENPLAPIGAKGRACFRKQTTNKVSCQLSWRGATTLIVYLHQFQIQLTIDIESLLHVMLRTHLFSILAE